MTYKHLHIVGCSPRSGTTLMAELCRTSFDIDGFYDFEKSIFKTDPWNYSILLSKAPPETIYFPWLLYLNPDLWCIYMLRDPRDAVVSKHSGEFLSNLRIWNTLHRSALRCMNHPRFITVKYEDLVTDPDKVQKILAQRIPFLKETNRFSAFGRKTETSDLSSKALHGARPISASSIGKWKSDKGRLKYQLSLHGDITDLLIELGYENSRNWAAALNDVEVDETHGGEPDFLPWHKHLRVKYRIFRKIFYYIYRTYIQKH